MATAVAHPGPVSPRQLATLLRVSNSLASSLDVNVVLQTAIEGAVEVLGLDMGVIYLLRDGSLYLHAATPPLPPEMPDEHRRATLADHPHLARCLSDLEPVVIHDAREEDLSPGERVVVESADLRSAIFAPMAVEGHALGAFIVHTRGRTADFGDDDISLCRTLSHQISLAIVNAQLFAEVQQKSADLSVAYDATLQGWSRALEMRDKETGGHTERVTKMAVRLAVRMGIPPADLIHVRRGALLHDIGKMVVPDAILHKPGPLSDEEWTIMRRHPDYARAMLGDIEYLRPALDIPCHHHERWDGSGYPAGMVAEEIPLSARIFAVIDVFDALVSDRPYRNAWTHDRAVAHIREHAGTDFDPQVVDVFLQEIAATPW